MTISTDDYKDIFTGNGSTTSFSFGFKAFSEAGVRVTHVDTTLGTHTELTNDVDYTLVLNADQENNPGGVITYPPATSTDAALSSTERLVVARGDSFTQDTDLYAGMPMQTLEDRFDYLTALCQQLKEKVHRSVRLGVSETADLEPFENAIDRRAKYLRFADNAAALPEAAELLVSGTTLSRSVIGGYLYPEVSAETSASATIADYGYPPGDIRRYGAAVDTVDNTTAIQDAINSAAHGGFAVFIPGASSSARYRFASTLYGYYHVTNNPNFPSGTNEDGRLMIVGEGAPNKANFIANAYRGSVLEYTAATGVGLDLYDDSGTESKAVVLRDFGLYATTSGFPVQMDRIPQMSIVDNVFIGNDGSGGAIKIDTWAASLRDCWFYGNGSGSGVAFDTSDGGGNVQWQNVNCENFDVGFDFGAAYDAGRASTDFIWNHMLLACQSKGNRIGYRCRAGVAAITFWDCWSETNTERGIALSDMAGWGDGYTNRGLIKIIGGNLVDTATTGFIHVEIGDDTGTETTDGVGPVLIDGLILGQVGGTTGTANDSIGIRIHNSTNAGFRNIRNLVAHDNAGLLCVIDDEAQYGTIYATNWDTSGSFTGNNRIENTSGQERSYWAVTDWQPLLSGTATFSYANAKRVPNLVCAQAAGDITITLPTSPEEHSCVITIGTANANQVVIDPNNGTSGETLNGSASALTFDGKYSKLLLSYDITQSWTISVVPQPQTGAYTPTNVSTDRAFDADAAAGAISASPSQAQVENIRDAVLELADVVGTMITDLQTGGIFD